MVIPPRIRRWPSTWRPGARPRPAGCTTTWPRAPRSSTGPLPARSAAEWHRSWWSGAAARGHDSLAARPPFLGRAVTGALGRGVAQVVVGAAGYDGRAFRYAKPGVR